MKLTGTITAIILAATLTACGGSKNNNSATTATMDLSAYTGDNAVASAATIDSLALEADFLTPEQGVAVLTGLSEIVKAEQTKGKKSLKLEYMRKFVDTYDILMSRSEQFTDEFENAVRNSGMDFRGLFTQYRDVLSSEADGTSIEDGGAGATEVKSATPASDSTATAQPETPAAPADTIAR